MRPEPFTASAERSRAAVVGVGDMINRAAAPAGDIRAEAERAGKGWGLRLEVADQEQNRQKNQIKTLRTKTACQHNEIHAGNLTHKLSPSPSTVLVIAQIRFEMSARSCAELDRAHLHCVHNFRADGNGADDDHHFALIQPALLRQGFQCCFNGVLKVE